MEENYGRLDIKLSELLKERGISRNKLSHKAEMSWGQVNSYCNNSVTRLDAAVLCKLCAVLNCRIEDILCYVPEKAGD